MPTNVPFLQMRNISFCSAEKKIKALEEAAIPTTMLVVPQAAGSASVQESDELKTLYTAV